MTKQNIKLPRLKPTPPPPPPLKMKQATNTEVMQGTILEAIENLLDGKEISEFAGSFELVSRVQGLIQNGESWKTMSMRLAESCKKTDQMWRKVLKVHQDLLRNLYTFLNCPTEQDENLGGYCGAIAMLIKQNEELGI